MKTTRFIATGPIGSTAIEILEQIAPVEIAPQSDEQTMLGLMENAIGFVARGEARITGRMIEGCPTLRVIGRSGAGYDTVDVATATACRIPVIYAPVNAFAVAEGALALLIALVKLIPRCDRIVRSGEWARRYDFYTGDLCGHTLGIVGLGRIGMHLAKLLQNFEMTILGYDPIVNAGAASAAGIERVELEELLRRSDFVSLHVPLNDATRGLINPETLNLIKPGAILVNTARGAVVSSLDDLADALESGRLSAIGLDVFPIEPPDPTHRIFRDPRLICAPHLLGVSELAIERIYRSMALDMVAVLLNRPPRYCVNPDVLQPAPSA